jgi:histidine ammonia-lyase
VIVGDLRNARELDTLDPSPDVVIDGRSLTLAEVGRLARRGARVDLSPEAYTAVHRCAEALARMIADGTPIYGVTTGFGALDGRSVDPSANEAQQHNLLKSHAAGVGPPMETAETRAMMAVRANVLASGVTGVRTECLTALVAMLNAGVTPAVPRTGSVGACGDLAPLAHMALPMIGHGRARIDDGPWLDGGDALAEAGIDPPAVIHRDGIALINGTEQTTGIGALALLDAQALTQAAEAVAALTLEAVGGLPDSFDERVALSKPHAGQTATSAALRAWLKDSQAVRPPRPSRLRDALSLRCIAQVLGAVRDALDRARHTVEIEINAANDNPLFGVDDGWVTSNSGNFHGQAVAEVLDHAATSVTSLAVISERRSARLVDANHNNGLPAFLIHPDARPGENSGYMIAQYTAAALVAELRQNAVPASIQSIPTCANTEDHVPMAPLAAQRLRRNLDAAWRVVAIEFLLACQALDLAGTPPAPALQPLYARLRAVVATMVTDRPLGEDIAQAEGILKANPDLAAPAAPADA